MVVRLLNLTISTDKYQYFIMGKGKKERSKKNKNKKETRKPIKRKSEGRKNKNFGDSQALIRLSMERQPIDLRMYEKMFSN